jgi:hypothetical protein
LKPAYPVIPGTKTVLFADGDPEFQPLPGIVLGDGTPTYPRTVYTVWQPTDEERQQIADGANIEVTQMTGPNPLRPMGVGVLYVVGRHAADLTPAIYASTLILPVGTEPVRVQLVGSDEHPEASAGG